MSIDIVPKEDEAEIMAIDIPCNRDDKVASITVRIKCPRCGKEHTHSWGTGWRVPHCKAERQYHINCDKAMVTTVRPQH